MSVYPYSSFHPSYADYLIENQNLMSESQRKICQESSVIVWVLPRSRKQISQKIRLKIYDRDGGECQLCGEGLPQNKFTLDHIIPFSLGGSDDDENLRLACQPCNSKRGNRI